MFAPHVNHASWCVCVCARFADVRVAGESGEDARRRHVAMEPPVTEAELDDVDFDALLEQQIALRGTS